MPAATPPRTDRIGPWTVHLCVTAACTRCGAVPLDDDTGLTPHFTSADQAMEELTQEWGWYFTARLGQAEELMCPLCAAKAGKVPAWPAAPEAASGQQPGTAPRWERPGQQCGLPANTAVPPAADAAREEG
jgi:hypothetical protein